jgi:hypothetical protein
MQFGSFMKYFAGYDLVLEGFPFTLPLLKSRSHSENDLLNDVHLL